MKTITLMVLALVLSIQKGYAYEQGNLVCESESNTPKYTFYIMRDWTLSSYYGLELYEIEYVRQAASINAGDGNFGTEEARSRLPVDGCQGVLAIYYNDGTEVKASTGTGKTSKELTLECPKAAKPSLDLNVVDGKVRGGSIKFPEGSSLPRVDEGTEIPFTCKYL